MLITSPRHTAADLAHWRQLEAMDRAYVARCGARLDDLAAKAHAAIARFADDGPCYVSTSWGKDSIVVAHLALTTRPAIPIRWFPAGVVENPDCTLVRDAFLARFPSADYREIEASDLIWTDGQHDGAQAAFVRAARTVGSRYISGVRADESGTRKMALKAHGVASAQSCRPIGWWTGSDVFAYLMRHDLPIHPAYACTMSGAYDRERVRVGTIGGQCGIGGREAWERRYYPEVIAIIGERNP